MNWLEKFATSAEARIDGRDADLALQWIAAWERSADYVEELKRQRKVAKWSLDEVAGSSCRRLAWFGELRAFQRWLKASADNPEARRVLAMTAEFEHKQVQKYLQASIQAYLRDPPDNDFLRGYLSALLVVAEEALGFPMEARPFVQALKLLRSSRDKWTAIDGAS